MLVTYIPRLLPLVLRPGRTPRPWQRRTLQLVPFAAIGALVIPDGLHAIEDDPLSSLCGLVVAAVVAVFVRKPIVVVLCSVGAVILVQWLCM